MMLDTIFMACLVIGGAILLTQFVMLLISGVDDAIGDAGGDMGSFGHDGGDAGAVGHGHAGSVDGPDGHARHAGNDPSSPSHNYWFFEMLSIRTLSAAATFFGLAGKAALGFGYSPPVAIVVATAVGYGALYGVYWIFRQALMLESSGAERIANAMNRPATVYVPIPGSHAGSGKVHLNMQGRMVEYEAVTDDETHLATGEHVVVVDIISGDTVKVARVEEPAAV